jgi:hypothetical protein
MVAPSILILHDSSIQQALCDCLQYSMIIHVSKKKTCKKLEIQNPESFICVFFP